MKEHITPLVDDVQYDGLGGIFGIKRSKVEAAPRVMVAAHMDEVGFMLTQINDNGLFQVVPLGGWNPYVVSAQRFTLKTSKGNYPCISSSIPPHLLRGTSGQKQLEVSDVLFDAGFSSKEEAESFGVRPGDSIVPQTETIKTANGKNIISKSWDNRYGCTLVLDALETLQNEELLEQTYKKKSVYVVLNHLFINLIQISSLRWIVQRQMIFTRKKGHMVI